MKSRTIVRFSVALLCVAVCKFALPSYSALSPEALATIRGGLTDYCTSTRDCEGGATCVNTGCGAGICCGCETGSKADIDFCANGDEDEICNYDSTKGCRANLQGTWNGSSCVNCNANPSGQRCGTIEYVNISGDAC